MKNKKILIAILLTFLVNIFCLPLWTECDYGGFMHTLCNKEARLDLLYSGKILRAEPVQYKVIPRPFYATWVYESGNNIHRANLSLRARGKWQKLSLQLKAQRDGKITMLFRGPDVHDEYGSFYSVLTDWQNIQINGKTILQKNEPLSFKRYFSKGFSVKRGDILHIEAEFRRHHFSIHDFTELKSGKVWYFVTGNLLFFSLIYLLLTYIEKRCESGRLSDMLFLIVFFAILFIPAIGISDAVNSRREARSLAVKPVLKDLLKGQKSDYGRRYENWLNDHFCGRAVLTKLHDVIRNKLSCIIRTGKAIYFKENGWEFLLPIVSNLDCRASNLQSIVGNLVRLNEFCQQNQIKLYVLEVPKKEIVYKEIIKENYGFERKMLAKVSQAQEFVRNEVRKHHIPLIYPYSALCDAAKEDFVFFKWTHHWTDWGGYVGYRELMREITKDFPDMPIVSLDEFWKYQSWLIRDLWGDSLDCRGTYRQLRQHFNYEGSNDFAKSVLYNYYDNKYGCEMAFKVGRYTKDFTYPRGKQKAMLIGTSQNEILCHFLPCSASQTKYIRLNQGQVKTADEFKVMKLYKKDILTFKPDILILSISSDDLYRLRDLFSTK